MNNLLVVDMDVVRELRLLGRFAEADSLLRQYHSSLKKQRDQDRREVNRARSRLHNFKNRQKKKEEVQKV